MSIKSKIALLSVISLVVISSVFGTMSYFRDTDVSRSTFTVGRIKLELSETNVDGKDTFGVTNNAERDSINNYHLVPGDSYVKDPTVTVKGNSEDAFVYMTLNINNYSKLLDAFPSDRFEGMYLSTVNKIINLEAFFNLNSNDWKYCGMNVVDDCAQYRFTYRSKVLKSADDNHLGSLFTTMKIPVEADEDNLALFEDLTIDIKAYAVQALGFENYNEAWKASFDEESKPFDLN